MAYKYFQPNKLDLKDDSADSCIRSVCASEDRAWIDIFDSFIPYMRRFQRFSYDKVVFNAYLEDNGYVYKTFGKEKKPTVAEFAKKFKKGTYILILSGYKVCVKEGVYLDTVDVGNCKVFSYWEKEK